MKSHAITSRAATLLLLAASVAEGSHGHGHSYPHNRQHLPRHVHSSVAESGDTDVEITDLEKRGGQCQFPTDAGLVAVTPNQQNAGWAMSPNQPCKPGNYCPYACPPGQVSMQWDPKAVSYAYPASMVCLNLSLSPSLASLSNHNQRMVGYTATTMDKSRSHSPRSPTALLEPVASVPRIRRLDMLHSVRLCFQATRPC